MNGALESAVRRRRRRLSFAPHEADDESSHALRQAIGYLGLLLPLLVWFLAGWRSVNGFPGRRPLDSISEYYHSGAVAVLTGALTVLAIFLWTYRGFDNRAGRYDRALGKVASLAALGVSLIP